MDQCRGMVHNVVVWYSLEASLSAWKIQ